MGREVGEVRAGTGLGAVLGEIPAAGRGYDGSSFARVWRALLRGRGVSFRVGVAELGAREVRNAGLGELFGAEVVGGGGQAGLDLEHGAVVDELVGDGLDLASLECCVFQRPL